MILVLLKLILRKHKDYWVVGSTGVFLMFNWSRFVKNELIRSHSNLCGSKLNKEWKFKFRQLSAWLKGSEQNHAPLFNGKNKWLDLIDKYSTFVLVLSPSLNRQRKREVSIVLSFPLLTRSTKMGRIQTPKVVAPVESLEHPEEWSYFTDLELVKSRGSSVCLTCEHFTYTCDKSCVTLLTCPFHQHSPHALHSM